MSCDKCKKKPIAPRAVIEIENPSEIVYFHKQTFSASIGDQNTNPPETLNYKNVLLYYEATGASYLFSSDGVPTPLYVPGVLIYDDIANRPQYDNEPMTSQTNIPKVPVSIMDLQDGERVAVLETKLDENTEQIVRLEGVISNNLNQDVEQSTSFSADVSTVTVEHSKVNLSNNTKTTTTDSLPVASATSAGVMNTATYNAVQDNAKKVDAILNGAVAIEDIAENPTQEELTTIWQTATKQEELINRASIYDVTNDKVWYYYTNISEWKPLTAPGGEVNISTFTNETAGIIKGSENNGQVYAEADGTGSVVGWDDLEARVSTLEDNTTDMKLYSAWGTNTDGALTQEFLNNVLQNAQGTLELAGGKQTGTGYSGSMVIGRFATSNVNGSIVIGSSAQATTPGDIVIGGGAKVIDAQSSTPWTRNIVIGNGAKVNGGSWSSDYQNHGIMAIGRKSNATVAGAIAIGAMAIASNLFSVALGDGAKTTREKEVSIGNATSSSTYSLKSRFLANVTAGELDTDAVNLKQMRDYVAENGGGWTFVETDANGWDKWKCGEMVRYTMVLNKGMTFNDQKPSDTTFELPTYYGTPVDLDGHTVSELLENYTFAFQSGFLFSDTAGTSLLAKIDNNVLPIKIISSDTFCSLKVWATSVATIPSGDPVNIKGTLVIESVTNPPLVA